MYLSNAHLSVAHVAIFIVVATIASSAGLNCLRLLSAILEDDASWLSNSLTVHLGSFHLLRSKLFEKKIAQMNWKKTILCFTL